MVKITHIYQILFLSIAFYAIDIFGQDSLNVHFDETEFHLNQIFELEGAVEHTFTFTNTGVSPILIKGVTTTCGCTSPEYSKELVAQGEKGFVRVVFNPAGQIGAFNQRILVYHSGSQKPSELRLSGLVIAGSADQEYKYQVGDLKVLSKQLNYGFVVKGESERLVLPIMNNANEALKVSLSDIPEGFDVMVRPIELQAQQYGIIEVTYNSGEVDDWDFIYHYIALEIDYLNSGKHARGLFTVTANVKETFKGMSGEDSLLAPVATVKKLTHHFDTLVDGQVAECGFELINEGKRDLYIRKIAPSCGCTIVEPDASVLKPGESTVIHATFDSKGRPGIINKGITLVTNDPFQPKQYLRLEGFVKGQ